MIFVGKSGAPSSTMILLFMSSVILMVPTSSSAETEIYRKDSNCTALDPVVNGFVNTSQSEYQQGDVIQVACNDGYEPHYTNTAQCREFGMIQFTPFTCKIKTCTVPTILPNGFINPFPNTDGLYTINTTITFTCKQNFTLIGVRTMKCLGNNRWAETGTPVCLSDSYMYEFALKKIHEEKANSCSLPTKLANGYIKPKPDKDGRFHNGTRVTFSCKEGYTLKGAHTMVCKGNDTWTEDENIFCLVDGYIEWQGIYISLIAVLLIATVILTVINLKHMHRQNQKETKQTRSLNTHNSSDESCPLMTGKDTTNSRQTITEDTCVETDNKLSEPVLSKIINESIPSSVIVPKTQDNNPNTSHVNVIHINNYINQEQTTDHTKRDRKADVSKREHKSEEKNKTSPIEESRVTIEASQEY